MATNTSIRKQLYYPKKAQLDAGNSELQCSVWLSWNILNCKFSGDIVSSSSDPVTSKLINLPPLWMPAECSRLSIQTFHFLETIHCSKVAPVTFEGTFNLSFKQTYKVVEYKNSNDERSAIIQ